jgi:hypothetical protein
MRMSTGGAGVGPFFTTSYDVSVGELSRGMRLK